MGVENLGYLAQFLGGMAQGKLLKQKRNAQATELKYKTDKMKADSEESILRKQYRDAMLGIARSKEARESLVPANASFLGGQITNAENTLAAKNKEYSEKLAKEGTIAGRRRVLADARRDIGQAFTNLNSLYKLPGVSNLFGGSPVDNIIGIAKQGVNPAFLDETVEPSLPDVSSVYDFKPGREQVQTLTTKGLTSGIDNPNYYLSALGPRYLQAVEDLSGGDPSLRPAAIRRVMSEYGNIEGLSPEGMEQYLTTGKVDLYRPLQVDPTRPTDMAMGLFDQLPTDQAQMLMGQQGGELGGPFKPSSYMMPEQIESGGASNQYGQLPGLASSVPTPTNAFNQVAIPYDLAAKKRREGLELRKLGADVTLSEQTLGANIQKIRNDALASGYKLAQAPIDLQSASYDNYVKQIKASRISEREVAEINQILANTTFRRNEDRRSEVKLNKDINDAIAKWITNKDTQLDQAVSYAQKNAETATLNISTGGAIIADWAKNNEALYQSIVSGKQDPRTVPGVPASAMTLLQDAYNANSMLNKAIKEKNAWDTDKKTVGPIIDSWMKFLKGDNKQEANPAGGNGKPKPGAKATPQKGGTKPSPLVKPDPSKGVTPSASMPD